MAKDRVPKGSLGILDSLLGYHLRRVSSVFGGAFARATDTRLRQVPFAILSVVAANPGIKQGDVGRLLSIQRANMVVLINELIDAGYVVRRPAKEDRRAFALFASDKGADALTLFAEEILRQEAVLLEAFSQTERKALLDLLQRLEARE